MRELAALTAALAVSAARIAVAAEAKEGMPQLNFANPLTISQVVWGAIIFVLLYFLLARWALPQVTEVLDARAASIAADLERARQAKEGADHATAEVAESTRKAQGEAQAAIARAIADAKAAAAAQASELNARLDAQLASAEQRIGAARSSALGALREVATETANNVVERLTGRPADAARVDAEVGAVLAARGQG